MHPQRHDDLKIDDVQDDEQELEHIRRGDQDDIDEDIDILSSSLSTLYSYTPITHAGAGDKFTYEYRGREGQRLRIELRTPDTSAKNWNLHASSIWVSAVYLADHIYDLGLDSWVKDKSGMEILELGAGAGLPGILISKQLSSPDTDDEVETSCGSNWRVTVSDYPDNTLIQTLHSNVSRNDLKLSQCRVVPHAWGEEVSQLLEGTDHCVETDRGFDLIVAADVLWNAALHGALIQSLKGLLRQNKQSRIHIVAGLHTGRYAIHGFLQAATAECKTQDATGSREEENSNTFQVVELENIEEREVAESVGSKVQRREWSADREDEDEMERRRWVVWIVLRWKC